MANDTQKVIIIGSGPAGFTSAIYTARANLDPVLFEGFYAGGLPPGGQLTTTTEVENFPGFAKGIMGPELMEEMKQQATRFGTKIISETVEELDLKSHPFTVKSSSQTMKAHSIIIATGARANRLDVPGDKELWTKGVSACAVCDGAIPMFRDKPLVVIGGGDSAVEEATYLTKYGSVVYMIHRRDELRASQIMQERAFKNEKLKIVWDSVLEKINGSDVVESVTLKNIKTNEKQDIQCTGVFYAIGHTPNTEFLNNQIELDDKKYIICKGNTSNTSIEGVFAAGDVRDSVYRQAITAAGTGCMAALDAERWLASKGIE
jgi:thioredoxin reductase (NADPH)